MYIFYNFSKSITHTAWLLHRPALRGLHINTLSNNPTDSVFIGPETWKHTVTPSTISFVFNKNTVDSSYYDPVNRSNIWHSLPSSIQMYRLIFMTHYIEASLENHDPLYIDISFDIYDSLYRLMKWHIWFSI